MQQYEGGVGPRLVGNRWNQIEMGKLNQVGEVIGEKVNKRRRKLGRQ